MISRLLQEIPRRRVPQVTAFYLAAGWIVFEVAESTFPRLGLPDWTVTLVLALLILALPFVVGLAWFYDVTPDGVRRTGTASQPTTEPPAPSAAVEPAAATADSQATRAFGRIALIGAILVLALAGGAFILFGGGEDRELASNTMAVLPFTVRGGADVGVLAEGMVELLSTKLDGAGELRSTDANAVLSLARGGVDPSRAREVARRLGAGRYLLGSVLEYGSNLTIQAAVYETAGPREAIAEASVEGPAADFLDLVDDLAAELLVAGGLAPPGRMSRIAALTTESLPALKLFLEGERAIRGQRYAEAIPLFERAVEADTAFALAYYRMSVAASWEERHDLRRRAMASALRHADRLSERDRALVEAWVATKEGRHAEAERRYRDIVRSHPDDMEAWYELGEVILHRGYMLGYALSDAREPFSRALALDPGHGASLFHLSNIAAGTGDRQLLDSVTAIMREDGSGSRDVTIEVQWAFAADDSAAIERALDDLASPDAPLFAAVFAGWATTEPRHIRRIAAANVTSRGASGAAAAFYSPFFADQLAGLGLRGEALDRLEEDVADARSDPVGLAMTAAEPFLRTPPERLERTRALLEAWDPGPVRTEPVPSNFFSPHEPLKPHLRLYLLALLENRLGRREEALRLAAQLAAMDGVPDVRTLAADLARHVRAQVAIDQDRPGDALATIEAASFWEATPWDERVSRALSAAASVLLRAEALHRMGHYREAIRWYRAAGSLPPYSAYVSYPIAQAYEELGEHARAAEHYARFLHLWADADPDLQDLVTDARRRLQGLTSEG